MANLKDGTVVNGSITGNLNGNATTASNLYVNEISTNTDLNTLTTAGLYSLTNQTASNNPANASTFIIRVDLVGSAYIRQTLYPAGNANVNIYVRSYDGSSWTAWNTLVAVNIE